MRIKSSAIKKDSISSRELNIQIASTTLNPIHFIFITFNFYVNLCFNRRLQSAVADNFEMSSLVFYVTPHAAFLHSKLKISEIQIH